MNKHLGFLFLFSLQFLIFIIFHCSLFKGLILAYGIIALYKPADQTILECSNLLANIKKTTSSCAKATTTGKNILPRSSHMASAPSFTINKVEKLLLQSGKEKFGQRCIEWITTARLLICMTAFPLRTIHLLNTQC